MIKTVTMYSVVCDGCGKAFETDDFIAWSDKISAVEQANESGWLGRNDKHYCPNCWGYVESVDEYVPKKKGGGK